jgi:uncharacterized protein (DUF4415 family)
MEKSVGGLSAKSSDVSLSSPTQSAKKAKRKSSASSRREKLVVVNVKNMKELPALTDDQRKQLETIDNLPDDRIDFSDIPEMTGHKGPVYVGLMYRPGKTSVTIRLDSDMVDWFKAQGKGWQTKMNWTLRLFFATHRKTGAVVGKP